MIVFSFGLLLVFAIPLSAVVETFTFSVVPSAPCRVVDASFILSVGLTFNSYVGDGVLEKR